MIDFDSGFAERQKYEMGKRPPGGRYASAVGIGPSAAASVALERKVDYFALC
jgi:hypothetical protein